MLANVTPPPPAPPQALSCPSSCVELEITLVSSVTTSCRWHPTEHLNELILYISYFILYIIFFHPNVSFEAVQQELVDILW